jgi:hypothetical protein
VPGPQPTPSALAPSATPQAPQAEDPGAFDVTQPLPAASIDSTLGADEDVLVAAALASDELTGFLQTDLVHDGGVVLFRSLALPEALAVRQAGPDAAQRTPGGGAKAPLRRQLERKGERELALRQACEVGEDCRAGKRRVKAEVAVRQVVRAQVTDSSGANATKRYAEVFRRELMLRPSAGKLALDAVGPLSLRAAGDVRGLDLREIAASVGEGTPLLAWRAGDRPVPVAQLPLLQAGAKLRVRVRVDGARPGGRLVLAGFPGQSWSERVKLVASGVDPTAGEYSGSVTVPPRAGATHLLVEAVDARGLEPAGSYRSVGLGLSARVGTSP